MPKLAKPLTDTQVKTAKSKEKSYTLADGRGMYLEVMPTESKYGCMAYRQESGKPNRLIFDSYPAVSLLEARAKRTTAHKQLADGISGQFKRDEKQAQAIVAARPFETVARTRLKKTAATLSPQRGINLPCRQGAACKDKGHK